MEVVFEWNAEKNQKLIKERNISFEVIVSHIEAGDVIAITAGKGKYRHQKQFVISVNKYIYVVPFVEEKERVFLKTIIPSRKMTRQYLFGGDEDEKI